MAKITRSQLGRRSRTKGSSFERTIKNRLKQVLGLSWPGVVIRRSVQADRAYEPDVVIEGVDVPELIRDLWLECNHSKEPNPGVKLAQALRDSSIARMATGRHRIPMVVWRRNKARTDNVTTTLAWLNYCTGMAYDDLHSEVEVTLPFEDLLKLLVGG